MSNLILRWLFNALGLLLIAEIVTGIKVEGIYSALIVALILGVLNVIIRPILIILTLPITVVTLGLFAFVINASLFWFVSTFVEGFKVVGFFDALLGSLLMSLISTIGNRWIRNSDNQPRVVYKEIR
jgi:putative membrane protein